ncbi:MAG: hypothetical protein EB100_01145 [Crocinitomicaceae bacterium]|nr:hypothetical protein [Crocinitomicaceae bacterium]
MSAPSIKIYRDKLVGVTFNVKDSLSQRLLSLSLDLIEITGNSKGLNSFSDVKSPIHPKLCIALPLK